MTHSTARYTSPTAHIRWSLCSAALAAFFGLLLCRAGKADAADTDAKATDAQTKQVLDQIMLKWIDAEIHHDAVALGKLLAEPFVATFDENEPVSRAAYLGGLTRGPADPTAKQEVRDENVIIDGDTAVMVLLNSMHGTAKGTHYDLSLRATVTFVRRNGQWQALALHGSLLKAAT